MTTNYLESIKKQFVYYKLLGDKTFVQLTDEKLFWQYNEESNSIAIIVKHLSGNMLSRWTDFLTTDGEKPTRNRDGEFIDGSETKEQLIVLWTNGWEVFMNTLYSLTENDLMKTVTIRSEKLTVMQALNRQTAHYAYHIGQIVFLAKHLKNNEWQWLSIPKNKSNEHLKTSYLNNLK